MIPLVFADTGEICIIKRVGGNPETKKRLKKLGFSAGAEVSVITQNAGNLIVCVNESRVAVSEEMARHIFV